MKHSDKFPTITILGTGFVGLSTGAVFAAAGFKTYLIDPNNERIQAVRDGHSFFYEEGIEPLIKKTVADKMLIPTQSYEESVPNSDIIISAVGTPDNPDGSSNLTYIFAAAEEAGQHLKPGAIYAQKSTVPVGTGRRVEAIFKDKGVNNSYVSNPEFLREGTAIADSLWFDRIVVGGDDPEAIEKLMQVYAEVQKQRETIAAAAKVDAPQKISPERYVATSLENAELIKVTSNSFLALKITFANSIAKLADASGADVKEIMDIVGDDWRIGRAFLNAGRGYGGGCFPKDVSGLISSALEHDVDLPIMTAVVDVNESMPGYIVNKAQNVIGDLASKKVAVLGLAFKSGTSDVRRSPGVTLANILDKSGATVQVYDPKANGEAKADLRHNITIAKSVEEATLNADTVFIATDWPEFSQLDLVKLKNDMNGDVFVDAMNAFNIQDVQSAGLRYVGVGRG